MLSGFTEAWEDEAAVVGEVDLEKMAGDMAVVDRWRVIIALLTVRVLVVRGESMVVRCVMVALLDSGLIELLRLCNELFPMFFC